MIPSRAGLIVARKYVRAVLSSPSFHANNSFLGSHIRNVTSYYYSTSPQQQQPQPQQQIESKPMTPQDAAIALRKAKMNLVCFIIIFLINLFARLY